MPVTLSGCAKHNRSSIGSGAPRPRRALSHSIELLPCSPSTAGLVRGRSPRLNLFGWREGRSPQPATSVWRQADFSLASQSAVHRTHLFVLGHPKRVSVSAECKSFGDAGQGWCVGAARGAGLDAGWRSDGIALPCPGARSACRGCGFRAAAAARRRDGESASAALVHTCWRPGQRCAGAQGRSV